MYWWLEKKSHCFCLHIVCHLILTTESWCPLQRTKYYIWIKYNFSKRFFFFLPFVYYALNNVMTWKKTKLKKKNFLGLSYCWKLKILLAYFSTVSIQSNYPQNLYYCYYYYCNRLCYIVHDIINTVCYYNTGYDVLALVVCVYAMYFSPRGLP